MDPELLGNLPIVFAISGAQNDPTSQGDLLGCVMDQFLKTLAFFISQFDFRRFWTRHGIHLRFPSLQSPSIRQHHFKWGGAPKIVWNAEALLQHLAVTWFQHFIGSIQT